jgi:hypothetical protein
MQKDSNYSGLGSRDLPAANDPLANAQGYTVSNNNLPTLPALPGKEEAKQQKESAKQQALRDQELLEINRQRQELERLRKLTEPRQANPGLGCRAIGCGLSLILLLLIAGLLYIFIARPIGIVNPLKTWLNGDLQPKAIKVESATVLLGSLEKQVQKFSTGNNTLLISEDQLNLLVNKSITTGAPVYFDAEQDQLKVYTNVDQQAQVPLFIVAEFGVGGENQNELTLNRIGTERIATPPVLSEAILDAILSAGKAVTGREADNILQLIIIFPENVEITGVQIKKDELALTLRVSTGLEGIFN